MQKSARERGEHVTMNEQRAQMNTALTQRVWQRLELVVADVENLQAGEVLYLGGQLNQFVA